MVQMLRATKSASRLSTCARGLKMHFRKKISLLWALTVSSRIQALKIWNCPLPSSPQSHLQRKPPPRKRPRQINRRNKMQTPRSSRTLVSMNLTKSHRENPRCSSTSCLATISSQRPSRANWEHARTAMAFLVAKMALQSLTRWCQLRNKRCFTWMARGSSPNIMDGFPRRMRHSKSSRRSIRLYRVSDRAKISK